ncbi:MAG: site-specific integrase [Bacteroides sp.]|nr:site-specific integrase [Bacteroides sp.]
MVAGHLRIQNGYYQMILSYKDGNGKRKTKSISTGLEAKGNKRNAERMLTAARQSFSPESSEGKNELPVTETENADNSKETGDSSPLFCDFLLEWLEMAKNSIEITTYGGYEYTVKRCIIPYFEPKQLTLNDLEKNPKIIQDYYQYEISERKLSTNTVIHRHANIRKCLQYAYQIGLINSNPADRVERPKKNAFTGSAYNEDELQDLFRLFQGDPLEFAVIAASFYGLRRSEVVGLKWNCIDFDANTITIRHVVTQATVNGRFITVAKDRAKNKSSLRTLPLVAPFKELLLKMKDEQAENRRICGKNYCTEYLDYIYLDPVGKLIRPDFVTQHFSLILEKNSFRKIRFHDLRHSCASLLFSHGVSLKEIQEWLGHSNISTTANIYTHMDFNKKISSANAIIGILSKEKESTSATN